MIDLSKEFAMLSQDLRQAHDEIERLRKDKSTLQINLVSAYHELSQLRAERDAVQEREPVAWINPDGTHVELSTKSTVYGSHTIPLYKVAPYWNDNERVLVPIVPTYLMLDKMTGEWHPDKQDGARVRYSEMLKASPDWNQVT